MSKKLKNTLIILNALILLYMSCLFILISQETEINNIKINSIKTINNLQTDSIIVLINRQNKIKRKNAEQTGKIISLVIKQMLLINEQAEIKQINKEQGLKITSIRKGSQILTSALVALTYEHYKTIEYLKDVETIDLKDVDKIKRANLLVGSATGEGSEGAGSHIKINNKSYILTCAHILGNQKLEYIAIDNDNVSYPLELIKVDEKVDLALLKVENIEHIPYLEISERYPQEGSKIMAIGHPGKMNDVVTEGVIAKIEPNKYITTNLIYSGNSGGAVLYRGKIVGITVRFLCYYTPPYITNYSQAINLNTIKEFLKEIK